MSDTLKFALPKALAWAMALGILAGVWKAAWTYGRINDFMEDNRGMPQRMIHLERTVEDHEKRVGRLERKAGIAEVSDVAGEVAIESYRK